VNEAEARTKRCPILRVVAISFAEITADRFPHCIASECMMWRLSYPERDDGFCGLAGGTGNASFGYPPGTTIPSPPPLPPSVSPSPPPSSPPSPTPSPPQVNPLRSRR
jgi:hypothetical protein